MWVGGRRLLRSCRCTAGSWGLGAHSTEMTPGRNKCQSECGCKGAAMATGFRVARQQTLCRVFALSAQGHGNVHDKHTRLQDQHAPLPLPSSAHPAHLVLPVSDPDLRLIPLPTLSAP